MPDQVFFKSKLFSHMFKQLLFSFSMILIRTQVDHKKFSHFVANNTYYISNIQNASSTMPYDKDLFVLLSEKIGQHPVWLCANTHRREGEMVIRTHKDLEQRGPNNIIY